ncbi:hypothetical protein K2X40_00305 [Candidatus Babeliales bacterium]|nr:hypothetical protein [Candidatus Babeliales bacterium]
MIAIFKKEKNFLTLLFLFSFVIRALVFFCYLSKENRFWQADSATYHQLATSIAAGKGVANANGDPAFYRVPGYPVFLAVHYALFGQEKTIALWFQVLIASLLPILIFFLSLALFPKMLVLARVASLYSAVHLGLVLYAGFFMTETLFLFFFLLFMLFFLPVNHLFFCSSPENGSLPPEKNWMNRIAGSLFLPRPACTGASFLELYEKMYGDDVENMYTMTRADKKLFECRQHVFQRLAWAGFFLGVASMVRPVGHYLLPLSMLMIFLSHDYWREKCAKSLLFIMAWIVPVSFWLLRNYMLVGQIFLHSLPGGHFLYFSAARVVAHEQHISYERAREVVHKKVRKREHAFKKEYHRVPNEYEHCAMQEKLAIGYFKHYPLTSLKLWLTDMFRTKFSLYSAELLYLESGRPEFDYFAPGRSWFSMIKRYLFPATNKLWLRAVIFVEIMSMLFMLLGFVLFVLSGFFRRRVSMICITSRVLPFMAFFIVISLAGGYARMRLPIEPFIILFAWHFWLYFFGIIKSHISHEQH